MEYTDVQKINLEVSVEALIEKTKNGELGWKKIENSTFVLEKEHSSHTIKKEEAQNTSSTPYKYFLIMKDKDDNEEISLNSDEPSKLSKLIKDLFEVVDRYYFSKVGEVLKKDLE